jgi:L-ascorbate metabolism protein UlaG (beta-lactamase superfamily)
MYIKKLGHCCLILKENDLTILTDPGSFSTAQNDVTGIDIVLITHEHADHLHIESLKTVLNNNPQAKVITNISVGKILEKENIAYTVVSHGQHTTEKGTEIEGLGTTHADIYKNITPVENTGYFIGKRLFYPGDALYDPERPVDILALPVVGPWVKISEAIDYGLKVKPKHVFPVHDGMLNEFGVSLYHRLPNKILSESGVVFHALKAGEEVEL